MRKEQENPHAVQVIYNVVMTLTHIALLELLLNTVEKELKAWKKWFDINKSSLNLSKTKFENCHIIEKNMLNDTEIEHM